MRIENAQADRFHSFMDAERRRLGVFCAHRARKWAGGGGGNGWGPDVLGGLGSVAGAEWKSRFSAVLREAQ